MKRKAEPRGIVGKSVERNRDPTNSNRGDNQPAGLGDSATAERLDEVLRLRALVKELEAAELPMGFGRD